MKAKQRLTSGRCYVCDGPARGGALHRRGVEMVPICKGCGQKGEQDLFMTHAQAKKLLAAARKDGPASELFARLGMDLGLRVSEITALQAKDFDWEERRVWVSTLKRKDHPRLPVYMSEQLAEILRGLIQEVRGAGWAGYLWPRTRGGWGFKKGGHVSRWVGMGWFRRLRELAGLPQKLSSHAMRHYCAIRTLEAVPDVYFASRQLRHSSIKTTERYLHLLPSRAADLAGRVPVTGG